MVTDVLALYAGRRGKFYKTKKYEEVDDEYEQVVGYWVTTFSSASLNQEECLLRTTEACVWHSDGALIWTKFALYEWNMVQDFFYKNI